MNNTEIIEIIKDAAFFGGCVQNENLEECRNFFDNVIEKQLSIAVVSNQRELLVDFWMNLPNTNKNKGVAKHYVDNYLESTNCG